MFDLLAILGMDVRAKESTVVWRDLQDRSHQVLEAIFLITLDIQVIFIIVGIENNILLTEIQVFLIVNSTVPMIKYP